MEPRRRQAPPRLLPNERCPVYILAALAGVTERHVRRLLKRHRPPGFYRTSGGHWRCRGPLTHARRLRVLALLKLSPALTRPERRRPVLDLIPPAADSWQPDLVQVCEVIARSSSTPAHLAFAHDFLAASHNIGPDEPGFFDPAEDVVPPAVAAAAQGDVWVVRLRAAAYRLNWAGLPMTAKNLALAMKISRATFFRFFPGQSNPVVAAARVDARKESPSASKGEIADFLTQEIDRQSRAGRPKRAPKST